MKPNPEVVAIIDAMALEISRLKQHCTFHRPAIEAMQLPITIADALAVEVEKLRTLVDDLSNLAPLTKPGMPADCLAESKPGDTVVLLGEINGKPAAIDASQFFRVDGPVTFIGPESQAEVFGPWPYAFGGSDGSVTPNWSAEVERRIDTLAENLMQHGRSQDVMRNIVLRMDEQLVHRFGVDWMAADKADEPTKPERDDSDPPASDAASVSRA